MNHGKSNEEQLEIINQYLKRVLVTMDFSFRTPLNSILGFANLLSKETYGSINSEQQLILEYISCSGKELMSNVNALTNLLKIDFNFLEYNITEFNLKSHMEELFKTIKKDFEKEGIVFSKQIDLQNQLITTDKAKLDQFLNAILLNAMKLTIEGDKVDLNVYKNNENNYVFEIIDNGIGYQNEMLENIFPEIYDTEEVSKSSLNTINIDLTIAKKLIEKLGGSIDVESSLGQGSKFKVTLPEKISIENLETDQG